MSHTYRKHDPVILLDRIHNGRRGHVCDVHLTDDEQQVLEILVDGISESVMRTPSQLQLEPTTGGERR